MDDCEKMPWPVVWQTGENVPVTVPEPEQVGAAAAPVNSSVTQPVVVSGSHVTRRLREGLPPCTYSIAKQPLGMTSTWKSVPTQPAPLKILRTRELPRAPRAAAAARRRRRRLRGGAVGGV